MKHYQPKNPECIHNKNCLDCFFLKDCFPKTYEKKMKAIDRKWKEKYGDEF